MTHRRKLSFTATALLLFMSGEYAAAKPYDYADSIELAVDRWLAVQKPSGFMPYGFDFLANEESEPATMSGANLTRQAGTASALADYYLLTSDQRAQPAIQAFLRAFGRHSLPIGKSRLQTLVEKTRLLSMPFGRYKIQTALQQFDLLYDTTGTGKVLSPNADYRNAHTGALALALLTELLYYQASGDASFADLRDAWLQGLIALRIPGDGFRLRPTSIDTTPYFDGETWLALAQYHRTFPQDARVAELLADVDTALMEKYGEPFTIAFFHWGTMAAAARYADTKDQKFLDFIKVQTGAFLDRKKGHVESHNTCASMEGIADAIGALSSAGQTGEKLAERAGEWLAVEMQKAKQLQIQPGQQELVFPNALVMAPRMQDFAGSFRGGIYKANTQVDYTQHCVSAMLKVARQRAPSAGN